ncbi:MAG: hypothetical protein WBB28_24810 [Crinalium sp.]
MPTTNLLPPASTPITKFLPPYPTSKQAKMLDAIAKLEATVLFLVSENYDPEIVLLFAELAASTIWSEECRKKVIDIGMQAALELYDHATINADYAQIQRDLDNPRRWKLYQEATEIWKRQEKELGTEPRS